MDRYANLVTRIKELRSADGLRFAAARNMGIALVVRISGMVTGILMQLVLARYLGIAEFGLYAYVWAIFLTLAILATFGFELSSIRFVARYITEQQWTELRGFVHFSRLFLVALSALIALVVAALLVWTPLMQALEADVRMTVYATLPLLPLYALVELHTGILRGGDALAKALLGNNVLFPALVIGLVAVGSRLAFPPSSVTVVGLSALSLLLVVAVQWFWIRTSLPRETWSDRSEYSLKDWLSVSWSMLLSSAAEQLTRQLGTLAVGSLVGVAAAGIYAIAMRFARLVNLGLQISNQSTAHMVTPLYVKNDHNGLQRVVSFTALVTALTTIPIVLVMAIWPTTVLGWFGKAFSAEGALPLQILLVGQLINAVSGPNGVVMQMTNHQSSMARISIAALIVQTVCIALLAPPLAVAGVALAFTLSLAVRNLSATWYVKRNLDINTTVFSRHILLAGLSR